MKALDGHLRLHLEEDNALPVFFGPESVPLRPAPDVASPSAASLAPAPGHAALVSGWLTTGLSSAGHALLVAAVVLALGSAGRDTQGEAALDVEFIVEPASAATVAAPEALEPQIAIDLPPPLPDPVIEVEQPRPVVAAPAIERPLDMPMPTAPAPTLDPAPEPSRPAVGPPPREAAGKDRTRRADQKQRTQALRHGAQRHARAGEQGSGHAQRAVAPPRGDNSASIDAFRAAVAARVARNKPDGSAADRAQGVVVVAFSVSESGAASAIRIASSSGHGLLDQAALSAVRRASPFPAPPPGAPRNFTVPMRFTAR